MTTLNISLPDVMRDFIERQVAQGGYRTASEYIRALVQEAQKREAREKVETLLLEGLHTGDPVEVTRKYWEKKRRKLKDQLRKTSDQ
jgi:antitoxin ParD1/3/4